LLKAKTFYKIVLNTLPQLYVSSFQSLIFICERIKILYRTKRRSFVVKFVVNDVESSEQVDTYRD